jgi:maleate cis-trans isomerase
VDKPAGWRGIVGLVKPTFRSGPLEEVIRLLPEGIGVIPLHVGVRGGTDQEFRDAIKVAGERVGELATMGVDYILVNGAPPPMFLGYPNDYALAKQLTEQHGIRVEFDTIVLLKALKAMSMKKIIFMSYTAGAQNEIFTKYLTDAKVNVVETVAVEATSFSGASFIQPTDVFRAAKKAYLEHPDVDGIYMLGGAWRVLGIIDTLEKDLGTTVLTGTQLTLWAILTALHVREAIPGYGKLLTEAI